MTLSEYLDNPMGKGDSTIPNRGLIKKDYDTRFTILNSKKRIKHFIYKTLKGDQYYIHIVIPTETERDNSYDVVFRFFDGDTGPTLSGYSVQFFCNSPSFVYTYAKVYKDNDLFIKGLQKLLPRETLSKPPTMRNRFGIINYDKYVYFAAKYIIENQLLVKVKINLKSKAFSPLTSFTSVRSFDKIMSDYQRAKDKLKKKQRKASPKQTATGEKTTNKSSKSVNTVKPIKAKAPIKGIKPIRKRK